MHLIQLSDTHLTHLGGVTNENFLRVVEVVNRLRPDYVVHTGDVAALLPDQAHDRATAARLLRRVRAPLLVLPGNHDVGSPGPDPWRGIAVTAGRVAAFRRMFGGDRWLEIPPRGPALLGLNSELLGSGLPDECEQWEWLEGEVPALGARPVLLFLHRPLWAPDREAAPVPPSLMVAAPARERLLQLFGPGQLRLVASGHLHRRRVHGREGLLEVWTPSTAFTSRSAYLPSEGAALGITEYWWDGEVEVREPPVEGLRTLLPEEIPELRQTLAAAGGATVDSRAGAQLVDTSNGAEEAVTERALPRSRRGQHTRAALIEAAREVFERDGFLDARIVDIAAAANVATGSFYTYFDDKDEIFAALMSETYEEQTGEEGFGSGPDPVAAVEAEIRTYLDAYRRNAGMRRLMEQVANIQDRFFQVRLRRMASTADRDAAIIRRLQQEGLADPEVDPLLAAVALGAMVSRTAYTVYCSGVPAEVDPAALARTLTRLWLNGLRIHSDPHPHHDPA